MGCLPSRPFSSSSSKPATAHMSSLQPLVRPAKYQGGKGPSFYAAYARAARRYGFETGRNAGFAKRNNVVVKVKSKHDKDTDHEVPAESIQNGAYLLPGTLPSVMSGQDAHAVVFARNLFLIRVSACMHL